MLPHTSSRIFFTVSPFWKADKNTSESVKLAMLKQRRPGCLYLSDDTADFLQRRESIVKPKFQDSEDSTRRRRVVPFRASGV